RSAAICRVSLLDIPSCSFLESLGFVNPSDTEQCFAGKLKGIPGEFRWILRFGRAEGHGLGKPTPRARLGCYRGWLCAEDGDQKPRPRLRGGVFGLGAKCALAALGDTKLATIDLYETGLFAFGRDFLKDRCV